MVAECVSAPHVRLSGDSHLFPPWQLFFLIFLLDFSSLHPCHLFCSLHASVLLTVPSTCHHPPPPPPHNCHINEQHANPIDKHTRVSRKPCSCNQKYTNWNAGTVKIICMGCDGARVVVFCTATHCVYAMPLSLLVECCYALLSLGEGNIQSHPLVINNYPPLHLPPQLSTALSCESNSKVTSASGTLMIATTPEKFI